MLTLRFSRVFCVFWLSIHTIAVIAASLLTLTFVQTTALYLVVLAHCAIGLYHYCQKRLIRIRALPHSVWQLEYANNVRIRANLLLTSLVSSKFMALHFDKHFPKKKVFAVIWPDALSQNEFKALMRACKAKRDSQSTNKLRVTGER